MRILTFTTLYPNAVQPAHGVFVEQRLRHLVATRRVGVKVIAPVPWFPARHKMFGRYTYFAGVHSEEERYGIQIQHPQYPVIPKVGMTVAPFLLSRWTRRVMQRVIEDGYDFDLIDAHYFYPDGVAAVILGHELRKPVVVTARGTDVNLIPRYALPRGMIRWAAKRAAAIVTVCNALKDALVEIGVSTSKITVLRNGVDLALFRPLDRPQIRMELNFSRRTLLSVGHLVERKGHDIPIRALKHIPDVELVIVGRGREEANLKKLCSLLNVEDRVRLVGHVDHNELKRYYSAADALVLASSREGWANVLLEAMACGTPVIATNTWGSPEIVTSPAAGVLMGDRTPESLVAAYQKLFSAYPDRQATRRYAERFGWDSTSQGQLRLFEKVLGQSVRS